MFTLCDAIDTDEEGFWSVYFDENFGRALHCDALQFQSFEVTEQRIEDDGTMVRRVDYRPRVPNMQKLAVKLVGDGSYTEHGRYDPQSRTYFATFNPKKGADTFVIHAEIRVTPLPDGRCERRLTVANKANVFGIGRLVENAAEQLQRRVNVETTKFMNQWIRERGL